MLGGGVGATSEGRGTPVVTRKGVRLSFEGFVMLVACLFGRWATWDCTRSLQNANYIGKTLAGG